MGIAAYWISIQFHGYGQTVEHLDCWKSSRCLKQTAYALLYGPRISSNQTFDERLRIQRWDQAYVDLIHLRFSSEDILHVGPAKYTPVFAKSSTLNSGKFGAGLNGFPCIFEQNTQFRSWRFTTCLPLDSWPKFSQCILIISPIMQHSLVTLVRWLMAGSSAGYFISYCNAEFCNLPLQRGNLQTCFPLTLVSTPPLATALPHLPVFLTEINSSEGGEILMFLTFSFNLVT